MTWGRGEFLICSEKEKEWWMVRVVIMTVVIRRAHSDFVDTKRKKIEMTMNAI